MTERTAELFQAAAERLDETDQKAIEEYPEAEKMVLEEHPDMAPSEVAAHAEELVPDAHQAYSKLLYHAESLAHGWKK